MKKLVLVLLVVGMLGVMVPLAMAGNPNNVTNQTITFQVRPINRIAVSGNPSPLIIITAVVGSQPTEVSDATTTYAITTNACYEGSEITASLDSDMPTGVTLTVNMAAPTGATSEGDVALTASPQAVVTGLVNVAESGDLITYKLDATVAAGVVASATRTVTFTLNDLR
jgi:hypothetical protein